MVRCFFEGCDINRKNAKEKGVKLLAVPNNRREEWLRAVKREDLLENPKVAKRLFICTRHFKEEHFMAADITKLKKVCLKPNAIPFILVGDGQSDIAFTDIGSSSHNLNSVELVNPSEVDDKSPNDFENFFISTDPGLSPKQEDDRRRVSPTITVKSEPDSDPYERDSAICENQEVDDKSPNDFENFFISTDPVLSPKQEDDPRRVSPTITVKPEHHSDPYERDSAICENQEVENIYTHDHGPLFESANTFLFPKQEDGPLAISPGVSAKLELVLEEEEEEPDSATSSRSEEEEDPLKLDSATSNNEGFQARPQLDNNVALEAPPPTAKKRYQCEICQKSFPSPSGLNIHQRTHTGEKPYQCDICNKSFKQAGNLYMHQRTHTGNKPYECLICMKRCASSSDLSRHTRIHTGDKPYTCLVCNKNFALASSLKKHHRIHTGDKPYVCVICEKKFSDCSSLSKHRRTHT